MTPAGAAGTASGPYRDEPPHVEGTDVLREQVARWLCEQRNDGGGWEYEPGRRYWREDADALLSGPLAPLLAKLRAVEELAEFLAATSAAPIHRKDAAERIRRALDAS